MPAKASLWSSNGMIEVAPNVALRRALRTGLRRFGPLTSKELADWAYWERHPFKSRLGERWRANRSAWSAARRAIARMRQDGMISIAGQVGRAKLYALEGE